MVEGRNIAEEFASSRIRSNARPYTIDLQEDQDRHEILDLLNSYGIPIRSNRLLHAKTYSEGCRDLMVTTLNRGYIIKDSQRDTGTRILPDSLVVNTDNNAQTRLYI